MNNLLLKIFHKIASKSIHSLSDNQTYPQFCNQASRDDVLFQDFRRNPIYTEILEHVTEAEGGEYLQIISENPKLFNLISDFRLNDDYGSPIRFDYGGVGMISPSTLRYIKVLSDLDTHFDTMDALNICEIGVGYGGQCRIIHAYYDPTAYCLVDIKPALALARRYLENYIIESNLSFKTMEELTQTDYDFVLSNYAFTELPRVLQDVYLDKIILNSKRGYITYNEITPKEFKSYKSDELASIIPGAQILEEKPLTHPKNCIIVWGTT